MGRNRYLEMSDYKDNYPIKWPVIFFAFEIKMFLDSRRNKDIAWYVRGIKRAKLMKKNKAGVQDYIDDAIRVINLNYS